MIPKFQVLACLSYWQVLRKLYLLVNVQFPENLRRVKQVLIIEDPVDALVPCPTHALSIGGRGT